MFRSKAPAGNDRKGYQATDPIAAVTDANEARSQMARTDKPTRLIETLRFIGGNQLEARDHALYEQLFAYARIIGIDKEEHEIFAADMMKFLGVDDIRRIETALERITDARVSYDFTDTENGITRRGFKAPLIIAESVEHLKSGTTTFVYSIPAPIRRYIAASREWTWLEIAAFPDFRSKYTAPFYQRLAAMAGTDTKRTWTVSPKELAEIVGYVPPKAGFNFAVFKRDVLTKILKDIDEGVSRFSVEMDDPKAVGKGRGTGRKISELVFRLHVTDIKPIEERPAAHLLPREIDMLRNASGLDEIVRPSTLAVGRAVTIADLPATDLINKWREALSSAKANPDASVDDGWQGAIILNQLKRKGADSAFLLYAESLCPATPAEESEEEQEEAPEEVSEKVEKAEEQEPSVDTDEENREETTEPPSILQREISDEAREAEYKQSAIKIANDILDALDGYFPGRQFRRGKIDAFFLTQYAYDGGHPFTVIRRHVEDEEAWSRIVVRGLEIVRKLPDQQLRDTMRNIAGAVKDWDISRLYRILKAVAAETEKGAIKTRKAPPAMPSHISKGGKRTLSEAASEIDFGDPAYDHVNKFDDRDRSDFESESTEEIPF